MLDLLRRGLFVLEAAAVAQVAGGEVGVPERHPCGCGGGRGWVAMELKFDGNVSR